MAEVRYFAAQVRTGGGEGFIRRFKAAHPGSGFPVYFLRKEMRERHRGSVIVRKQPLFPGYIFIRIGEDGANLRFLRETEGFVRFLRSNRDISPLCGRYLETVLRFTGNPGGVAGISKVYFNSDDRIVVPEGPRAGTKAG